MITWHRTLHSIGPHGEVMEQWTCEHERLLMLIQRPSPEAEFVVSYHVTGIDAQHWHTADEALNAMRANP